MMPTPPPTDANPPRLTNTTADFLGTVPLFSGLDRSNLESFAELTRERSYPRGSVILFENDPGDSLFIVRSGRVKVVLIGEDGREVILGVLGVGQHFGELALIDEQPRSAHVIAMEDASLIVLRREDFRKRVEENPAVAWSLLMEMSRRLRRADDKIGGLVLLDVPGRIARLLLDLSEESGTEMIAGWINVDRRRISLANRGALEQRAQVRE
jgi:CRP/FNR family cyclic AMP-dependent transcriptional regulator